MTEKDANSSKLSFASDAGSALIAEALELACRLPRVWTRVRAGELPPWRARRIADRTICLPPEGAEYVAVCLPAFSPDTVHRDDG